MKTSTALFIGALIIGLSYYIVSIKSDTVSQDTVKTVETGEASMKDGVQYITITAHGGYSPKVTTARAGIKTKLVMKTDQTFDCSSSLVIPSLGIRKMLPNTGEVTIDIPEDKTEGSLRGLCSMGMYTFLISFK